jgi:copper(I)-binding protein
MKTLVSFLTLALSLSPSFAQNIKLGDLTIENAWARATPKGAEVGAGYMTIRNDGAVADRLTAISTDFAKVQMHEMKMSNGVMEMRELPDGVEIPAHGVVKFAPGGNHLMFVGLKSPLVKGATAHATLTFAHAGSATVEMPIQGAGASGPMAPMKGM